MANKTHIGRGAPAGQLVTYCGMVGWPAKFGQNEYENTLGDRFECEPDKTKATCKTCRKAANQLPHHQEAVK